MPKEGSVWVENDEFCYVDEFGKVHKINPEDLEVQGENDLGAGESTEDDGDGDIIIQDDRRLVLYPSGEFILKGNNVN